MLYLVSIWKLVNLQIRLAVIVYQGLYLDGWLSTDTPSPCGLTGPSTLHRRYGEDALVTNTCMAAYYDGLAARLKPIGFV